MQLIRNTFVASMAFLILVVFAQEFVQISYLIKIESVLLVLMLATCLLLSKGISLYISLIVFVIGHFLLFKYDMDFAVWYDAITKNLPLAILFVVAPMISIPLREGGYLKAFNYYIKKNSQHAGRLFGILSSFVFSLGAITNLGSVRVTHSLVEDVELPKKFLANIYIVGFSACITWSPYFGSVNLILYYTNVAFTEFVAYGFLYGVFLLIGGNLLFNMNTKLKDKVQNISKQDDIAEIKDEEKKVPKLILNLVLLLVEVVIAEKLFDFSNMMLMVSFVAFFHSIIWSFFIKKLPEFWKRMKRYSNVVFQVRNEIVFFMSAGFFGVIAANTPIKGFITSLFTNVSGLSIFILVEFIIILTALLSCVGIHQVITVTTIGLSLDPSILGFHSIAFALTLLGGWVGAMVFSPLAPYNIVVGGLLSESTFKITARYNFAFGIVMLLVSGVYISLVNMWLM